MKLLSLVLCCLRQHSPRDGEIRVETVLSTDLKSRELVIEMRGVDDWSKCSLMFSLGSLRKGGCLARLFL